MTAKHCHVWHLNDSSYSIQDTHRLKMTQRVSYKSKNVSYLPELFFFFFDNRIDAPKEDMESTSVNTMHS